MYINHILLTEHAQCLQVVAGEVELVVAAPAARVRRVRIVRIVRTDTRSVRTGVIALQDRRIAFFLVHQFSVLVGNNPVFCLVS